MAERLFSSPSRRTTTPSTPGERRNGQMEGLLSEFRDLYESKLRRLDEAERAGEDTQKVI